jgi:predicted lipid-binding transport protein (Tim44 family)/uncharacterized Zn finger protein (UPF0148 family)
MKLQTLEPRTSWFSRLRPIILLCLIALFVAILSGQLFARAGGAGGASDSFGFSGSSDDGDILFFLIFILLDVIGPIPTIIIVAIVAIVMKVTARQRHHQHNTVRQTMAAERASNQESKEVATFKSIHQEFNQQEFFQKVKTSFLEIQQAWQDQSMGRVRRYVSDSLYQRFQTQFLMMGLLEQRNELSNIQIRKVWLQGAELAGTTETLSVGITATITDKFTCKTNPQLNSGGTETFTEYWNYTRRLTSTPKAGAQSQTNEFPNQAPYSQGKDLYRSQECPSCSAPLPDDLGERGECPYCNALVNSGEYDWVLSEIIQAEDLGTARALANRAGNQAKVNQLLGQIPGQSKQTLEDQATNGYLQILSGIVRQDPSAIRRFTSDNLFSRLEQQVRNSGIVYNRIFTNYATLIGVSQQGQRIQAQVLIKLSYQRAQLTNGKAKLLDQALFTKEEVLTLERDIPKAGANKGSLLMHQCPACGAPAQNSLDTSCPYCNTSYTGGTHDWVVTNLSSFDSYSKNKPSHEVTSVQPKHLEQLYDVKDYALINMMVMLAADGKYSQAERDFAEKVAKSLGFDPKGLDSLFAQASAGRLGLRMPHQVQKRGKVYRLMEQAAKADGHVDPREQAVLDQIRSAYMIPDL